MNRKKEYLLYQIFYSGKTDENKLVYVGKAERSLENQLRKHFFQNPKRRILDIGRVSHIEYIPFRTRADMLVAEQILLHRHKPVLNREHSASDALTLELPDFPSLAYECPHLERWKKEIQDRDTVFGMLEKEKSLLMEAHRTMRKEIFSKKELPPEEKANRWTAWLVMYYEPAMERVNTKEVNAW